MKKCIFPLVIILVLSLLIWYLNDYNTIIGSDIEELKSRFPQMDYLAELIVLQDGSNYLVVITEHGTVQKTVSFSPDRSSYDVIGMKLVSQGNLKQYLDRSLSSIEEEYGPFHADIETCVFRPSYITEDGHLVYFVMYKDIVIEVVECDLLSGDSIETGRIHGQIWDDLLKQMEEETQDTLDASNPKG